MGVAGVVGEFAVTAVPDTGEAALVPLRGAEPRGGHLVLGEGAGLVGADGGDAAQRLHGVQPFHQGTALGHPTHTKAQGHRNHNWEAFGYRRNRQRHGNVENLEWGP